MTRETDAGHSCTDVQSDKDLMGGKCGLLICGGFLERQNGYDDSNSWQEFEREVQMLFYIWKQLFIPLPYCTVVKLNYPASTRLLRQNCASQWYALFFS